LPIVIQEVETVVSVRDIDDLQPRCAGRSGTDERLDGGGDVRVFVAYPGQDDG
jgi:hypothetical protein